MEKILRRKFIKSSGLAAAGAMLCLTNCGESSEKSENGGKSRRTSRSNSRVAQCRRPEWFTLGEKANPQRIEQLLTKTLQVFFNTQDPRQGLREMFDPNDKIAVKVNCLSGRNMSTHTQIAWGMVEWLKKIGVNEDNITIWDRADIDLIRGGYQLNSLKGVKVYGVDSSGFSRELIIHRSIGSFIGKIVERCEKIINLPVLKDHGIVGVTLSLKNFFGAIHNPYKYHHNNGDPYVADLYSHPLIKDKTVLTVIDGIAGQYEGGPPPQPQWQWNFGGLIAGADPVALDRIGLDIIESLRSEKGIPSLSEASRYPVYLVTAEELGLGNYQRENIDLIDG
ncbi:MAG: DUF362 domain-containing protein [candidate division Zixibacteria bacterium]|nr:DUF362 domain-containing protein [Candidatus Tariuqbacter arcticus]